MYIGRCLITILYINKKISQYHWNYIMLKRQNIMISYWQFILRQFQSHKITDVLLMSVSKSIMIVIFHPHLHTSHALQLILNELKKFKSYLILIQCYFSVGILAWLKQFKLVIFFTTQICFRLIVSTPTEHNFGKKIKLT